MALGARNYECNPRLSIVDLNFPRPNLSLSFSCTTFVANIDANRTTNGTIGGNSLMVIDFFVDVMFIVDILINFRTTYINKKDEVGLITGMASLQLDVKLVIHLNY